MHSSHGSRPDGSRCIAPPRASIPESADSVAHLSRRHKGKVAKKKRRRHRATAFSQLPRVQCPKSYILCLLSSVLSFRLSFVFCPLSFVLIPF